MLVKLTANTKYNRSSGLESTNDRVKPNIKKAIVLKPSTTTAIAVIYCCGAFLSDGKI